MSALRDRATAAGACPGCGAAGAGPEPAPTGAPGAEARFNASAACLEAVQSLAARGLARGDAAFTHQHAVDAFAAQHAGGPAKPIAAAYALVGLCLALERGFTGRQVQLAHMALARQRVAWPELEPRPVRFTVTVHEVLAAGEDDAAALRRWMASTWSAWSTHHGVVREWIARHRLAATGPAR